MSCALDWYALKEASLQIVWMNIFAKYMEQLEKMLELTGISSSSLRVLGSRVGLNYWLCCVSPWTLWELLKQMRRDDTRSVNSSTVSVLNLKLPQTLADPFFEKRVSQELIWCTCSSYVLQKHDIESQAFPSLYIVNCKIKIKKQWLENNNKQFLKYVSSWASAFFGLLPFRVPFWNGSHTTKWDLTKKAGQV